MIDNKNIFPKEIDWLPICDRRFGIGGDGLFIWKWSDANFKIYYNSDGNQSTMCSNGEVFSG
jgi:diaminopimelate epimerase